MAGLYHLPTCTIPAASANVWINLRYWEAHIDGDRESTYSARLVTGNPSRFLDRVFVKWQ